MAHTHELVAESSTLGQETFDFQEVGLHHVSPNSLPWNLSPTSHHSDDVEAAFDAQNIHDDMLAFCTKLEKKVLMCMSDRTLLPAVAHIREAALCFMSQLTQLMNMPPNAWFQSVTLFDVYCLSMPNGPPIEQIPATCIALVKLLKKMDCTVANAIPADLSPLGVPMEKWLENLGHTVPPITNRSIAKVELCLLQALNWQLDVPNVEFWMSKFCARLNVLTRSALMTSLNWIWEQGICYARMILLKQVSNPAHPPIQMATGSIALGCVRAQLLPVAAIRPPKVCTQAWDQSFAESQPDGMIPECVLPPAQSQQLLQFLQVSTGANLEEIREACRVLVPFMKDAYVNMLQMSSNSSTHAQHSVI